MKKFDDIISKYDYYDTHTHINSFPLIEKIDEIIDNCKKNKVMMNAIGTNIQDSIEAVNQAKKYENVFATVGIHPAYVNINTIESDFHSLEELLKNNNGEIVAIGEVGLDYKYNKDTKEIQILFLKKFFDLGRKYHLPIELHICCAHDDAIKFLKQNGHGLKLILHCYNATIEQTKQYIDMGCYFSFSGMVTFKKKVNEIIAAVNMIDINHIIIETDCPYLSPEPIRGTENVPINVIHIFKKIAMIKNINEEDLKNILRNNALSIFGK